MTGLELVESLLTDTLLFFGMMVTPLRSLSCPDNEISNGVTSLIFSSLSSVSYTHLTLPTKA